MIEIANYLKRLRKESIVQPTTATLLKRRAEGVLFIDSISEEIKKMLTTESGCGFTSLIKVLRHFDSDLLKSKEKQKQLVRDFKNNFGDLDAILIPQDIIKFCTKFDLGMKIVAFHYKIDRFDPQILNSEFNAVSSAAIDFPLIGFQPPNQIIIEDNQIGIVGLENSHGGHYLCSEEVDIFSAQAPGGNWEMNRYMNQGYQITEVIVFEKGKIT